MQKRKKESSFKIGQLVRCLSPNLCEFVGVGIIVDLEWPNIAYVHTQEGNTLCIKTDKITIEKN